MDVVVFLEVENVAKVFVTTLFEKFQAWGKLLFVNDQPVFAINGILPGAEIKLIVRAHDNRFFGAYFFTISTEDAAEHVYLKGFGISFLFVIGYFCSLHTDCQRRARTRTQPAGYTTLFAFLSYEYGSSPKFSPKNRLFLRVLDRNRWFKHVLEGEPHAFENFREIQLSHKIEIALFFATLDNALFRCHTFCLNMLPEYKVG